MYYYPAYGFFGMHAFWWAFWLLGLIFLFSFATPVRRTTWRELNTPLSLLQRRYAAGEITTAEYEERKAVLERDSGSGSVPRAGGPVAPAGGPPV
jgi:putative membrane protein